MADKKELQEKILTYRILESKLDSLLKQRDMMTSRFLEVQNAIQSIDEIEKSKNEILFPIGSGVYTVGKVAEKDKLIVEIGANVAIEKNPGEGKQMLTKRKSDIENGLNSIQMGIAEISSSLEQLGQEIQELSEK